MKAWVYFNIEIHKSEHVFQISNEYMHRPTNE